MMDFEKLQTEIQELLQQRYADILKKDQNIIVTLTKDAERIFLECKIGSEKRADIFSIFTISQSIQSGEDNCYMLVDFLGNVLERFFNNTRKGGLPLDYAPFALQGHTVYAKHEMRNYELEALADELLKKSENSH